MGSSGRIRKTVVYKGYARNSCGSYSVPKLGGQNGNKRTTIEINVDEISFGETKKSRESNAGYDNGFNNSGYNGGYDNGSQIRPDNNYSAPAFDLPVGDSDFAELGDDDGDVPF